LDANDKNQPRDHELNPHGATPHGETPPGESPLPDDLAAEVPVDPYAGPPTAAQWLRANGPMLVFVAAILVLLCMFFDPFALIKVAVGLGFIIFIHELGHFLVAKWCDVHVTTFSIGFGPALPFCSWTWGETTYKLAAFPLGGYVQMVGQVDGDESGDGSDDDPRSYRNKTVWQRMAIISAGVIMNAIFACVAFLLVFLIPGKPRQAAVVAAVDSGKPAFVDGVRTAAVFTKVNDIDHPYFEDLKFTTIATLGPLDLEMQRIGKDPRPVAYHIEPHQGSVRTIGVLPTSRLQLVPKKMAPELTSPAFPNSPAAAQGFEWEDVIVGVTDPDHPDDAARMILPNDPRRDDGKMKDFFEFQRRMTLLAGKPVTIVVERGPEANRQRVSIKVEPAYHKTLGVRMKMDQITAVRKGSAAAKAGILTPRPGAKEGTTLEGDTIKAVEVKEPDGKLTRWEKGKDLDPVRLPQQLKDWADRVWTAAKQNPTAEQRQVKLLLQRRSAENGGATFVDLEVVLDWDYDWRFDRVMAFSFTSPEAIPELGLAYLVKNEVDTVVPGFSPQLKPGEKIVDVNFVFSKPDGNGTTESGWQAAKAKKSEAFKGSAEWAHLFLSMQSPLLVKIKAKVERGSGVEEIELTPLEDKTWPLDERGLILDRDTRDEKADSVLHAIEMGFRDTHRSMMQVYLHLRGLVAGTISVENLGGPVAITTTAYRVAQYDFWEFMFFLGLISVNLAVLNFLPIPVLDGGHMVFLVYEKLRGRPASEGVRVGATYAGLLLIGCLMIFVLVLDIRRLVGG
jgi:regulator of sigma E protease